MEDFTELIQRLLEIQSGGRSRSPRVVADDDSLVDRLRKRDLAEELSRGVTLSKDTSEGKRVKA